MLKSHLILIARLIRKKPGFYLPNIIALSCSIATFLMIAQYAIYHFRFDNFHPMGDDIYRVVFNYHREGREPYVGAANFPRVGPALVEEFPEIDLQCRIVPILEGATFRHEEEYFPAAYVQYVDTSFFQIFGFEMIHGHSNTALREVRSIVLSDKISQRIYGSENPVGKSIRMQTIDGSYDYQISGVFKYQENTHLQSEVLVSFPSLLQIVGEVGNTNWSWFDYVTYVHLQPQAKRSSVEEKFPNFIDKHGGERLGSQTISFSLQRLNDIHLKSDLNQELATNANLSTILFLLGVSGLVLFIAWINYINLYTAKAQERSKEVGIRKTHGSTKKQLMIQFLLESAILNGFAMIGALFMSYELSPLFEFWLGLEFAHDIYFELFFWLSIIAFWLVSTIISGFYPSWILTHQKPLSALNFARSRSQKISFRKAMITWQFISSSGLIVATMVITNQVHLMNEQELGIDVEDTYVVEIPDYNRDPSDHIRRMDQLRHEILNAAGVTHVSYSSDIPGEEVGWRGSTYRTDQSRGSRSRELIMKMTVGTNFLAHYNIDILAGRGFASVGDSNTVIINEEALKLYGFKTTDEAINSYLYFTGLDTLRVIGVVENFHQESLKEFFKPTAYFLTPQEIKYLSIKVSSDQDLPDLSPLFIEIVPNIPYEPILLTEKMKSRHHEEHVFLIVFRLFTFLAIMLCAVGIIGLASYTVSKKEKEIAIRKVLGSYIQSIIWNILKEFVGLALLANLLLLPGIYYLSNSWLNQFAFHDGFNWWFPIMALLLNLFLVLSFSVVHIWKVAHINPCHTLNKEA